MAMKKSMWLAFVCVLVSGFLAPGCSWSTRRVMTPAGHVQGRVLCEQKQCGISSLRYVSLLGKNKNPVRVGGATSAVDFIGRRYQSGISLENRFECTDTVDVAELVDEPQLLSERQVSWTDAFRAEFSFGIEVDILREISDMAVEDPEVVPDSAPADWEASVAAAIRRSVNDTTKGKATFFHYYQGLTPDGISGVRLACAGHLSETVSSVTYFRMSGAGFVTNLARELVAQLGAELGWQSTVSADLVARLEQQFTAIVTAKVNEQSFLAAAGWMQ